MKEWHGNKWNSCLFQNETHQEVTWTNISKRLLSSNTNNRMISQRGDCRVWEYYSLNLKFIFLTNWIYPDWRSASLAISSNVKNMPAPIIGKWWSAWLSCSHNNKNLNNNNILKHKLVLNSRRGCLRRSIKLWKRWGNIIRRMRLK